MLHPIQRGSLKPFFQGSYEVGLPQNARPLPLHGFLLEQDHMKWPITG